MCVRVCACVHTVFVCVYLQSPWVDHIRVKMVADIVLDTIAKNGHTSTSDALWAGVDVVSPLHPHPLQY